MSTPPPRSSVPGKPNEAGAVRGRKKRGLLPLWLLLGLLALIALALILYFSLRGTSKKAAVVAPVAPVATTAIASPSDVPSAIPPPVDTSSPVDTSTAAPATTAGTPAAVPTPAATAAGGNLVGGAGKSAVPATGKDAEPGDTGTVLFAENSSTVDAQGQAVITAAAATLKADKATKVAVTGYTDKVAGAPINDPLSQERADKVAAILRSDIGTGVTVSTSAKGENDPAATNVTADGRAQNRRAVISNLTG